jgi:hypothetical protein
MPLYQQLIVALPKFPNEGLVKLMQKFTKIVMDNGGVVRSIENNGVRPLAEKAKRLLFFVCLMFAFAILTTFHYFCTVGDMPLQKVRDIFGMPDILLQHLMQVQKFSLKLKDF